MVVLEAMKMENELAAPRAGRIAEVRCAEGSRGRSRSGSRRRRASRTNLQRARDRPPTERHGVIGVAPRTARISARCAWPHRCNSAAAWKDQLGSGVAASGAVLLLATAARAQDVRADTHRGRTSRCTLADSNGKRPHERSAGDLLQPRTLRLSHDPHRDVDAQQRCRRRPRTPAPLDAQLMIGPATATTPRAGCGSLPGTLVSSPPV